MKTNVLKKVRTFSPRRPLSPETRILYYAKKQRAASIKLLNQKSTAELLRALKRETQRVTELAKEDDEAVSYQMAVDCVTFTNAIERKSTQANKNTKSLTLADRRKIAERILTMRHMQNTP
jgi:hypothetical protein